MSETLEAPAVAGYAPVKGGVVAYLNPDGAVKAAGINAEAGGAEIAAMHRVDDKGRTMHIHLYLNGSSLMLGDGYPEQGPPAMPAQGFQLTLMTSDIEAAFKRAV